LLARCGDRYLRFGKYEGALHEPLVKWFGPSPPVKE
jgi:hypothetical protein